MNNKKGFTLAELLVVVAIIAVLVAIAIPVFSNQIEKAREAVDIANIRSAYSEIKNARNIDNNKTYYKELFPVQTVKGWQSIDKEEYLFDDHREIKYWDTEPYRGSGTFYAVYYKESSDIVGFQVTQRYPANDWVNVDDLNAN